MTRARSLGVSRAALVLAALALASGAAAYDEPTDDALVAAHRAADPLALARVARAIPEARLADLLARGSVPQRLAAARGAPSAADPLALVGPLAAAMAAGDPELAPAAARALLAIVARGATGDRMEHSANELRAAVAPAVALADDARARPDLRAAARAVQAALAP